jgi:regulator of protease activity HflC (stomatin/prohibitin superfamily)
MAAKVNHLRRKNQAAKYQYDNWQQRLANGQLDAQSATSTWSAEASKDLSGIISPITIPWFVADVFKSLGLDYDERVLPSIGNEVLKAIVAQFDAAELITQREAVSNRIRTDLLRRAQEFNIALEDVSITHMTFGREFTRAVEQKQIAQQDAERARFIVEKAEQERQANVIRAEGEAESADIISRAVAKAGDGLIQIRRIEASRDIAQTLANNPNVTYLPGGDGGKDGGKSTSLLLGLRNWAGREYSVFGKAFTGV